MDPRAKERHEEEHEDSKKERKARTTSYYTENPRLSTWFEPTTKQSSKRNGSYDKEQCIENVKKTYECKHCKIQRFF
jgi:hypothetical protein